MGEQLRGMSKLGAIVDAEKFSPENIFAEVYTI